MEKQTDDQIAVAIVKETQTLFPSFKACSFDKGFHSPANQTELKVMLDQVTLPKKGKLSSKDEAHETSDAFVAARKSAFRSRVRHQRTGGAWTGQVP